MNKETYLAEVRVAHRKILEAAQYLRNAAQPFADTPQRRDIETVAADAERLARGLEDHMQEVLREIWQGE